MDSLATRAQVARHIIARFERLSLANPALEIMDRLALAVGASLEELVLDSSPQLKLSLRSYPQPQLSPLHPPLFEQLMNTEEPKTKGKVMDCTNLGGQTFLGVPFNIASYALLTHMVAQQCDLDVGEFIWTGGDCHIYDNHHTQVELQLGRAPFAYPTLNIKRRPGSIFDYQYDDFEVVGYECHPAIKAPVAV